MAQKLPAELEQLKLTGDERALYSRCIHALEWITRNLQPLVGDGYTLQAFEPAKLHRESAFKNGSRAEVDKVLDVLRQHEMIREPLIETEDSTGGLQILRSPLMAATGGRPKELLVLSGVFENKTAGTIIGAFCVRVAAERIWKDTDGVPTYCLDALNNVPDSVVQELGFESAQPAAAAAIGQPTPELSRDGIIPDAKGPTPAFGNVEKLTEYSRALLAGERPKGVMALVDFTASLPQGMLYVKQGQVFDSSPEVIKQLIDAGFPVVPVGAQIKDYWCPKCLERIPGGQPPGRAALRVKQKITLVFRGLLLALNPDLIIEAREVSEFVRAHVHENMLEEIVENLHFLICPRCQLRLNPDKVGVLRPQPLLNQPSQ